MTARETYEIVRVDDLDLRFEPRPWPFADTRAAAIDAHWAMLTAANPHLFNGRVLLQHRTGIVEEGGRQVFRGAYLETEFKAFLAWRDFGFPDTGVRNCFSSGALLSADGAFIVGEMSAHTANPGRVYFPAGTPDPQDIRGGRVDLLESVLRELTEETGLPSGNLTLGEGWTLLTCPYRIACIKTVRSPDPAYAIAERIHAFLARDPAPELARVHILRGRADCAGLDLPPFMLTYLDAVWRGAQPG